MSTYTEWTEALEKELSAPFAPEAHKTKTQGGSSITFVSWHEYANRLNEVVGPQNWSAGMPVFHEVGGKLVIAVPVTVLGVTKVNVGDEDEDKDSFGTACTNAWAQAMKRSCALFGLGLYLYDKAGTRGQRAPTQTRSSTPRQPAGNSNNGGASTKQLGLIEVLLKSGVFSEDERNAYAAKIAAGVSKSEASAMIDRIQEEKDRRVKNAVPQG